MASQALPGVNISYSNDALGTQAPAQDGISALIVSGPSTGNFNNDEVLGPFKSIDQVENAGIDENYDDTNDVLAHRHCLDFFNEAGAGKTLYVMVVTQSTLMADMADKSKDYAAKLLETVNGPIRLLGITRVPDGTYSPTYSDGIDPDVINAITNAKALVTEQQSKHRPINVVIEGRDYQGTPTGLKDLRDSTSSPEANRCSVIIGNDYSVSSDRTAYEKYASVGIDIGRLARISVEKNPGRVMDGPVSIEQAGTSDGQKLDNLSDVNKETLNGRGYIFFRKITGKTGFYINDSHTATPVTDDYAYQEFGRVIDKAARITYDVYVDEILGNVEVDPNNGQLAPGVAEYYRKIIESAITARMVSRGEASGRQAFVDPEQNILANSELDVQLKVIPKGVLRQLNAELGFLNPLNS